MYHLVVDDADQYKDISSRWVGGEAGGGGIPTVEKEYLMAQI